MKHARQKELLKELIAEIRGLRQAVEQLASAHHPSPVLEALPVASRNGHAPSTIQASPNEAAPVSAVPLPLPVIVPSESARPSLAQTWLEAQGVSIVRCSEPTEADVTMDSIARRIGLDYPYIEKLHAALRANQNTGRRVSLAMRGATQLELSKCTWHATEFNQLGAIRNYVYDRGARTLRFDPPQDPLFINFFNGGWFERYTRTILHEVVERAGLRAETLSNAQIQFGDGDYYELDLFSVVDGEPLWIECKTSDPSSFISRYSSHRNRLGVRAERALLVGLRLSEQKAQSLSHLWNLNVVNLDGFAPALAELFPPVTHVEQEGEADAAVDAVKPSATMVGNSEDGEE
ncbi:MAG TPA: hypothetical protein DCZ72_02450 [Armatimonadetes bacterium]|nr:hypothetical protein [Armatimonadota bacterium]